MIKLELTLDAHLGEVDEQTLDEVAGVVIEVLNSSSRSRLPIWGTGVVGAAGTVRALSVMIRNPD